MFDYLTSSWDFCPFEAVYKQIKWFKRLFCWSVSALTHFPQMKHTQFFECVTFDLCHRWWESRECNLFISTSTSVLGWLDGFPSLFPPYKTRLKVCSHHTWLLTAPLKSSLICAQTRKNTGVLKKTLYLQCIYIQITFFMCCIVPVTYLVYNLKRQKTVSAENCIVTSEVKLFKPELHLKACSRWKHWFSFNQEGTETYDRRYMFS